MGFLWIPIYFIPMKMKFTLLYCMCVLAHPCVCFHIPSAWILCSASARFMGEMDTSVLPHSHQNQHCFCLVSGCGAGQHTGWDILAQVPYNSLGSSPDPPNYSWIQKANTQSRPSSASDVCHEPEAVKLGSTSGHHFVLYVGRGGKEVSKKSFPNW